jgi:delta14-sterol reductase
MFYLGWELNPRFRSIDFKMFLYLSGAVMLEMNVLSGLVYHYSKNHTLSWPLIVYCCELGWFVFDYVYHEHVQLYTYDLFAENVGFKLVWGCLCFYPYFYSIGLPVLSEGDQGEVPMLALVLSVVLFTTGYILSRGANNQKYRFKIDPEAKFFGFIEQKSIGGNLLVSGFWGVSRHVNYLGEVLMAIGLAIPGGWSSGSVLPWLYPLYYVVLLISREKEDYTRCKQKYGKLWEEYVAQVPWKIVPYVY